jgi:RNA polymerase sigma-70 factor (ECF subfamily)
MPSQTTTHTSLLERLRGDSAVAAWGEFVERYGDLIRGFARRRGVQPADCDDVVQEVLLSLSRTLPGFQYDPAKGKFRAFLKTVALRTIVDRSRQKREAAGGVLEEAVERAGHESELEEAWEAEWRQYHLRKALRVIQVEFADTDCQAFRYYALEQRDARETAASVGLSTDQVYQAKSRIVRRLSTLIQAQVDEEG